MCYCCAMLLLILTNLLMCFVEHFYKGFKLLGILQHDISNHCSAGSQGTWWKKEMTVTSSCIPAGCFTK